MIFPLASSFWTIVLLHMLLQIVRYRKSIELTYKHHILCWGSSVFITFIIYVNSSYDAPGNDDNDDAGWCFIANDDPGWTACWYWAAFYGWIWLSIICCFVIIFYLLYEINLLRTRLQGPLRKTIIKILLFSWCLVFSWLPVTCLDTYIALNMTYFNHYRIFTYSAYTLSCSQGTLYAMVYFSYHQSEVESLYNIFLSARMYCISLSFMISKSSVVPEILPLQRDNTVSVIISSALPEILTSPANKNLKAAFSLGGSGIAPLSFSSDTN